MEKHFVVTAYIMAKINGQDKVLLHKHAKLGIWIGIGGHIEPGENPEQALIREIKEETDLSVRLLNSNKRNIRTNAVKSLIPPFVIYEEKIPSYRHQKSHYHIDIKYLVAVRSPHKVKMKEEFAWFSIKDLNKFKLDKDVKNDAQNALRTYCIDR